MILPLFFSTLTFAQEFADAFRPGPSKYRFQFEEHFYAPANVAGSDRELEQRQWRVRGQAPVWKSEKTEVTFGADAGDLVLHHPSTVLDTYRNVQGTIGVRRFGVENQVRSFNFGYGSASDRPFARSENSFINANYLHQFNAKWWGALNYSNNRNFANGIPLPGFFYVAEMTREETLLLGLPFVFWRKRYESGFDVQSTVFFPWNYSFQAGYFWKPFTGLSLMYEHRPQQYFRDDREKNEERFFYREQKASLVFSHAFIPSVLQLRVEGGYAFNRSFFEAENFSDKKRFDIPIDDALYAGVHLTSQF